MRTHGLRDTSNSCHHNEALTCDVEAQGIGSSAVVVCIAGARYVAKIGLLHLLNPVHRNLVEAEAAQPVLKA